MSSSINSSSQKALAECETLEGLNSLLQEKCEVKTGLLLGRKISFGDRTADISLSDVLKKYEELKKATPGTEDAAVCKAIEARISVIQKEGKMTPLLTVIARLIAQLMGKNKTEVLDNPAPIASRNKPQYVATEGDVNETLKTVMSNQGTFGHVSPLYTRKLQQFTEDGALNEDNIHLFPKMFMALYITLPAEQAHTLSAELETKQSAIEGLCDCGEAYATASPERQQEMREEAFSKLKPRLAEKVAPLWREAFPSDALRASAPSSTSTILEAIPQKIEEGALFQSAKKLVELSQKLSTVSKSQTVKTQ